MLCLPASVSPYSADLTAAAIFACSRIAQAQIRDQQAQDTSVNITRGARTLTGRLPAVGDGSDSRQEWKLATGNMKQAMSQGTFEPFKAALEKGLIVYSSKLEYFVPEASTLLRRRRLYRAGGGAVRDTAAGDAASAPFLALMQRVVRHMVQVSELNLHDVANYEMYLFFTSCLLGTATLRDQAYRQNLIDDVYMDEAGHVNESIFAPLQSKVKASASESGHLLVADVKPKESTLSWLMMVCAVRPMRAVLHDAPLNKQIWGLSGIDNCLVSRSAWANRIQVLAKYIWAHLEQVCKVCWHFICLKIALSGLCSPRFCLTANTTGHGVYRLMCITTKIYDVRKKYGGITEPRARSTLLSHAHRCNTSLETMLVRANAYHQCSLNSPHLQID
jgi:hypothetical protein